MILISKNKDFSALGLGKFTNYESETNALISVAGYSAGKADAIDVFFKSVKSFKSKIRTAFLLHNDFNQSKYNLFATTESLIAVGTPNITTSGFQPSSGNILNTNVKLINEDGALFVFQNNSITKGLDGVAMGADAGSGTSIFYITKDLYSIGARGIIDVNTCQTDATKYLNRGSVLFGFNSTAKLFLDGDLKQSGAISPSNFSTENIHIGGFATSNYYSAKIGFASIFNELPTDAEVVIFHNAVSQLMTDLGM